MVDKDGIDRLVNLAIHAARLAGREILKYYKSEFAFSMKEDGSPITAADIASHEIICNYLSREKYPVISEEGMHSVSELSHYWLVDPLDGTKDFLAKNDEFTINIALIQDSMPVIGVIYAPVFDELFVGVPARRLVWSEVNGRKISFSTQTRAKNLRLAVSRFHNVKATELFSKANSIVEEVSIGAALKYCRIVGGNIDVYLRLVGTSEWDTAAGQAILEASGGAIIDLQTMRPLQYGKSKKRNGKFLAFRSPYKINEFIIPDSIFSYRLGCDE